MVLENAQGDEKEHSDSEPGRVPRYGPANPWRMRFRSMSKLMTGPALAKSIGAGLRSVENYASPDKEMPGPQIWFRKALASIDLPGVGRYTHLEQLRDLGYFTAEEMYDVIGNSSRDLLVEIQRCAQVLVDREASAWTRLTPSMWSVGDALMDHMRTEGTNLYGVFVGDRWQTTNFQVRGGRHFPRITHFGVEFIKNPTSPTRSDADARIAKVLDEEYPTDEAKSELSSSWNAESSSRQIQQDRLELRHWTKRGVMPNVVNWYGEHATAIDRSLLPGPRASEPRHIALSTVESSRTTDDRTAGAPVHASWQTENPETPRSVRLVVLVAPMALAGASMGRLAADACGWPSRTMNLLTSNMIGSSVRALGERKRTVLFDQTCEWLQAHIPATLSLVTVGVLTHAAHTYERGIRATISPALISLLNDPRVLPVVVTDDWSDKSFSSFYVRQQAIAGPERLTYDSAGRAAKIAATTRAAARAVFESPTANGGVLRLAEAWNWTAQRRGEHSFEPAHIVDGAVVGAFQLAHLLQHGVLPENAGKVEHMHLESSSVLGRNQQQLRKCFKEYARRTEGLPGPALVSATKKDLDID